MNRKLRVLIAGKRSSLDHVLAANLRQWGHDVVIWPSGEEVDVLLYDLDENVALAGGKDAPGVQMPLPGMYVKNWEQALQARFIIVLGSRSLSRTTLEQMGAIAMLQKPFEMGRLQRYLRVFQDVLQGSRERGGETERAEQVSGGESKRRILVVDDDIIIAEAIQQCLLYDTHYEVIVAHDGLEAVDQCLYWQPDCVVTDLIMPWMNGYQVMRCLAASSLRTMPAFVVLSALTQLEKPVERSYLQGKVVVYVDKPFVFEQLLTSIEQVCREKDRINI